MSLASVSLANGELCLAGVLDYRTGAHLREQGKALVAQVAGNEVVVDCSAVEKASSVGVSLLLAFSRDARAAGKALKVRAMPQELCQIADVCGISALLERA
ncbi:STAS domain-containing protein [Pseudomonas sp. RIT-PI-S]|uniref:STAS domain-containing protein n=1 Tax=Pseudomonas sp. RIT-PI-S TaxID=3035295 RepID=UPI0021DB2F4C|nr:STAS domain-containing protein [Pseudomonas sp. RIT-PI-S]